MRGTIGAAERVAAVMVVAYSGCAGYVCGGGQRARREGESLRAEVQLGQWLSTFVNG
jgi:hypothetical protein